MNLQELIDQQRPGYSLDQIFYRSPEIYQIEVDRIMSRNWCFAGHVSEIPNKGDYFLFKIGEETVIVIRGRGDEIHALINVCRHRGSQICTKEKGSVNVLTCPYHAWAYDFDGTLKVAQHMGPDFDASQHHLHRAQIEVLGGMIYVCLAKKPPSLEPAKQDLQPVFDMFGFDNMKLAAKRRYHFKANWKLAVENYHECYHCAPSHPEYAAMHTLKLGPDEIEKRQAHMREAMGSCGLKTIEFDHLDDRQPSHIQGYAYSRTALFEGIKTGSQDGQPLAPLLGDLKDFDQGGSDLSIGPFSFFLIYSDHMVGYRFLPEDVDNCTCDIYWMVRGDAVEGRDYDVEKLTWLWHITTLADEDIIVNNQKGVNSRFYQPGPYSQMEHWTQRSMAWYLREMSQF
ncbi:MAG: aromatic ring-hydroxylating dioxygenase subunit alpha [Alphaproteobacteria bacterium]|nr:MAG: aromatic ring-hydroxylating dioxygenase subunit alpha [Alphaproteobacteria bacterium]